MNIVDDPREILRKILTIINYQEDKEKFIDDFLDKCYHRALVDMALKLPFIERENFERKLSKAKNQQEIKIIVEPFIEREEYANFLEIATVKLFSDFIKSILLELSQSQRSQIKKVIEPFFLKNRR